MTEPEFFATRAGADQAVRTGNRRRLRTAATTGLAALAVTGVTLAGPWDGAGHRDSLTPARDPLVTATATPSPSTTTRPAPDTSPSPVAAGTHPAPTVTATTVPPVSVSAPPSAAPIPTRAVHRSSPITRGTATIAPGDLCQDDQTNAARGWCVRYTGPTKARRGHPVALRMELCRLGSFPSATVTFTSGREALMSLQGTDWEAGQGVQYSSPGRTLSVAPAACLTWTSTWDTRGSDGFLVLPGSYPVYVGVETNDVAFTTSSGPSIEVTD
jgi:hypothetical protein